MGVFVPDFVRVIILVMFAITLFMLIKRNQSKKKIKTNGNTYSDLRSQAFQMTPRLLQLDSSYEQYQVYGMIMEIGVKGGTATLVTYIDGNASIYFSTGGGVIGGFAHDNVREKAISFVKSAPEFLSSMVQINEYLSPREGNVTFNALTREGIFTVTAKEKELQEKAASIWPLYYMGQDVITQLRLIGGNK